MRSLFESLFSASTAILVNKLFFNVVDPNLKEAFEPELDDLVRLHYLVTSRNVTTILEY